MTTQVVRLSGNEWEYWANKLLTCHYGPTDYQKVPANDKGDAGIEGFSVTAGHAFQAYGCEEPLLTRKRFDAQRKKMTQDISKFIKNEAVLVKIFGTVQIRRWILFVPYYDSKDIVSHASTKTAEVLAANLPYVTPDFRVMVCQEDDYSIERDQLLNANVSALQIDVDKSTIDQITSWTSSNSGLFAILEEKIGRLPAIQTAVHRRSFCEQVLKWYLEGQALLDALRIYPEVYEKVLRAKNHRENYLAMAMIGNGSTNECFNAIIEALKETLKTEVRELHSYNAETLAHEAVADWLLRCPLNFPEVVLNE